MIRHSLFSFCEVWREIYYKVRAVVSLGDDRPNFDVRNLFEKFYLENFAKSTLSQIQSGIKFHPKTTSL